MPGPEVTCGLSQNGQFAAGRPIHAAQHSHCGGLSTAAGPDQATDQTAGDLKCKVEDSYAVGELMGRLLGVDDGGDEFVRVGERLRSVFNCRLKRVSHGYLLR